MVLTRLETILLALAHLTPHKKAHISSLTPYLLSPAEVNNLKQLNPTNHNQLNKDWWPAELPQPHVFPKPVFEGRLGGGLILGPASKSLTTVPQLRQR